MKFFDKVPTPALVWLAAFSSATATWLFGCWLRLLTGLVVPSELTYTMMALSGAVGGIAVFVSRADA